MSGAQPPNTYPEGTSSIQTTEAVMAAVQGPIQSQQAQLDFIRPLSPPPTRLPPIRTQFSQNEHLQRSPRLAPVEPRTQLPPPLSGSSVFQPSRQSPAYRQRSPQSRRPLPSPYEATAYPRPDLPRIESTPDVGWQQRDVRPEQAPTSTGIKRSRSGSGWGGDSPPPQIVRRPAVSPQDHEPGSADAASFTSSASALQPIRQGQGEETRQVWDHVNFLTRFTNPPENRYRLQLRQQPEAARACGFGERDRRVIDPPPIVQVHHVDSSSGAIVADDDSEVFEVVHASLWDETGAANMTNLSLASRRPAQRLVGTLVACGVVATDEHQNRGVFFTFTDLSIRTHGSYRLKFAYMRVDPLEQELGSTTPIETEIMSDVFTVYSAKEFPGMRRSSGLMQALKRQGVTIQAKKGKKEPSSRGNPYEEDEGDEEDEPESSEPKQFELAERRRRH